MALAADVLGVLTDIEGTTTPVSFVYEVLFPYAAERLEEACAKSGDDPEIAAAVALLRQDYEGERRSGETRLPPFGDGAAFARWLMSRDSKASGLKALQGLIWRHGYSSGGLVGEVFPDVPEALEAWRRAGVRIRVFSSGSVLAQELLFTHSSAGDLSGYFEGFHHASSGGKREPESYAAIARAFALPPGQVLFLSDVVAELDAAAAAGMQTGLVRRPGNAPVPPSPLHHAYTSFAELLPRASAAEA